MNTKDSLAAILKRREKCLENLAQGLEALVKLCDENHLNEVEHVADKRNTWLQNLETDSLALRQILATDPPLPAEMQTMLRRQEVTLALYLQKEKAMLKNWEARQDALGEEIQTLLRKIKIHDSYDIPDSNLLSRRKDQTI